MFRKKESMLHVPIFHDVFYFYQFYDLQVQKTLRTKINLQNSMILCPFNLLKIKNNSRLAHIILEKKNILIDITIRRRML